MTNRFENSEFLDTLENIRRDIEPSEKNKRLREQIRRREFLLFPDESVIESEKQERADRQAQALLDQQVEIEQALKLLGY